MRITPTARKASSGASSEGRLTAAMSRSAGGGRGKGFPGWAALAVGACAVLPIGLASAQMPSAPPPQAEPAAAVTLVPHRAIYDLKLASTRGKRSVSTVRGRILYDFDGNACEGYTLAFRQVTELDSDEGKSITSDLRSTNWEAGDGKSFRFTTKNLVNGQMSTESAGNATIEDGKLAVALTKPTQKRVESGAAVFPSEQTRRIIAAGRAGKSVMQLDVYDGSEDGEKFYKTLAVIGQPLGADHPPTDAAAGQAAMAGLKRWPVTISYFDARKADGDQTPAYAISFENYENGISSALKLDYGDFTLAGTMSSLEIKPAKPCP